MQSVGTSWNNEIKWMILCGWHSCFMVWYETECLC